MLLSGEIASRLLTDWLDSTTGNGALHLMARNGNVVMLDLLLDAGADQIIAR